MPEAEPFTFFGVLNYDEDGNLLTDTSVLFNGFPFQLEKIDVSEFEYWITLGGTSKANVDSLTEPQKQANKAASLQNAVRLYWNLYGINYTYVDEDIRSINVDDDLIAGSAEPRGRAIYPSGSIEISDTPAGSDPPGFLGFQVRLKFRNGNNAGVDYSPIVALYDSDTFLGYGLDFPESKDQILAKNEGPSFGDFPILYDTLATIPGQFIGLCSYIPALATGTYTTISDIHLIKIIDGTLPPQISIDSFEFYTYSN